MSTSSIPRPPPFIPTRQTPSIEEDVDAKRVFWTETALMILSLSIIGAFGVGFTACVITIPTIHLYVAIGVIGLSILSSLVIYNNNLPDQNSDNPSPSTHQTTDLQNESSQGLFSSFFSSKKISIIGTTATDDQLKAASFKLPNPSSNCFMHATLQLIFQDKAVSDYFMQALDGIGKNQTFKDLNPALTFNTIEVKNQKLYKGDSEFKTIDALKAKLVKLKNDQKAIEEFEGFSSYLGIKEKIGLLEKQKEELLAKRSKPVEAKDIDALKRRIEGIDVQIKAIIIPEKPLAAGAASASKDSTEKDFSKEYAEHLGLAKQIAVLEKKYSEWTQYTELKALHQKDIDTIIARYKAVNKEDLYKKADIKDEDLEDLYYALSIQDAAKKAHAILTQWRTDKEISANTSKILRVCLTKLLLEETIISIPNPSKTQILPSFDELIKETHKGKGTPKYGIDRSCPTNLVITERDPEGKPINAWVFIQDSANPDVFRHKGQIVFSTKEKALEALSKEEDRKPKFTLQNNCHKKHGKEEGSIAFSYHVQDDAPKLIDELAQSLFKLYPTLPCPFHARRYGQTKRCTYEDETLPSETVEEPLIEQDFKPTIRIESEDSSIDLVKDLLKGFEKHVTKPDIPYINSGADKISTMTEGRKYYTEYFRWITLPSKLIIAPTFASVQSGSPTLVKKALKFTDNDNLIIDLPAVGEKPDGSKPNGGKYILNGFTLKSGSERGGHYVYYARHYQKEGDITTSFWIKTSDASVSAVSCEEVARILLTKYESNLHPNTLIFDQLKEPIAKE